MGDAKTNIEIVDDAISEATRRGVTMLTAEDERLDGRIVTLDGEKLINFGSCSYLGLETDPRLAAGRRAARGSAAAAGAARPRRPGRSWRYGTCEKKLRRGLELAQRHAVGLY